MSKALQQLYSLDSNINVFNLSHSLSHTHTLSLTHSHTNKVPQHFTRLDLALPDTNSKKNIPYEKKKRLKLTKSCTVSVFYVLHRLQQMGSVLICHPDGCLPPLSEGVLKTGRQVGGPGVAGEQVFWVLHFGRRSWLQPCEARRSSQLCRRGSQEQAGGQLEVQP